MVLSLNSRVPNNSHEKCFTTFLPHFLLPFIRDSLLPQSLFKIVTRPDVPPPRSGIRSQQGEWERPVDSQGEDNIIPHLLGLETMHTNTNVNIYITILTYIKTHVQKNSKTKLQKELYGIPVTVIYIL